MTREEIARLLKLVYSAYPNAKIKDIKTMVDAWEMTFGSYDAEAVYKAARLHMETNRFFPTPADIKEKMVKAKVVFGEATVTALPSPATEDNEKMEGWLDAFCEWIGFGCEPNDDALEEYYQANPEMRAKMSGILPYEV